MFIRYNKFNQTSYIHIIRVEILLYARNKQLKAKVSQKCYLLPRIHRGIALLRIRLSLKSETVQLGGVVLVACEGRRGEAILLLCWQACSAGWLDELHRPLAGYVLAEQRKGAVRLLSSAFFNLLFFGLHCTPAVCISSTSASNQWRPLI